MKTIKILAVDLGLRTGCALFDECGRLTEYFSKHFVSRPVLRKAAYQILKSRPGITHLVIEGGGELATAWSRDAGKMDITVITVSAEQWRHDFLYEKERKTGKIAKKNADFLARSVIDWAGAKKATSLRHDCAEAILAGFWVAVKMKCCKTLPLEIGKRFSNNSTGKSVSTLVPR